MNAQLPPTDAADCRKFIRGRVDPSVPHGCVHELFEAQVSRSPNAAAVECRGETLTYHELNVRANQLAHRLRRLGVKGNTRVGVSMHRSIDVVVAIYAILKAGGAYVPIDPGYPDDRRRYMIEAAALSVLLTHSDVAENQQPAAGLTVVHVDREQESLATEPSGNPSAIASPDDLIYIIFTSGSTGRPKGAGVYHRGFTNLLHWFTTEFAIGATDRTLLVSSLSFDLTQKNLFAPLVRGGTLHMQPDGPYDVIRLRDAIRRHGITLINCTPSAFYPIIEDADARVFEGLASLRIAFLGGEPVSTTRLRPWMHNPHCRAEVANTYGPTECTDICGAYRLTRDNADQYPFVPLGRPIYNVQLAILDAGLQPCPVGTPGELCVGGAGVGAGYVNDTELTAQRFLPSTIPEFESHLLYRTGDQARWMPDGVIEFLGRLDFQVKIRGFRIELHEIETALQAHPAIKEAIVVARTRTEGADAELACYFTTNPGTLPTSAELKAFALQRLPEYMVPHFERVETFPLSPNGKVDRKALAIWKPRTETPLATLHRETAHDGSVGEHVAQVWREVLEQNDIGPDDNFFDIGGTSINIARVHAKLQARLGRTFPLTDLFAHATLRTLAAHFERPPATGATGSAVHDRARRQQEAFAARRLHRRS